MIPVEYEYGTVRAEQNELERIRYEQNDEATDGLI